MKSMHSTMTLTLFNVMLYTIPTIVIHLRIVYNTYEIIECIT